MSPTLPLYHQVPRICDHDLQRRRPELKCRRAYDWNVANRSLAEDTTRVTTKANSIGSHRCTTADGGFTSQLTRRHRPQARAVREEAGRRRAEYFWLYRHRRRRQHSAESSDSWRQWVPRTDWATDEKTEGKHVCMNALLSPWSFGRENRRIEHRASTE